MIEIHNHKTITVSDESRVGVMVEAEYENKWYHLTVRYKGETLTIQEFQDPILLNKIARAIDNMIQDADLQRKERRKA
jgi:hypothetical protein